MILDRTIYQNIHTLELVETRRFVTIICDDEEHDAVMFVPRGRAGYYIMTPTEFEMKYRLIETNEKRKYRD